MNNHEGALKNQKSNDYLESLARVDLYGSFGIGLIIPHPTKIVISNQVAGHANYIQAVEGFYVPINNDSYTDGSATKLQGELDNWFCHGPKYKGWCSRGMDEEDAKFIDALLLKARSGMKIEVDRSQLQSCTEAWVHVIVTLEKDYVVKGVNLNKAFLTWKNSD